MAELFFIRLTLTICLYLIWLLCYTTYGCCHFCCSSTNQATEESENGKVDVNIVVNKDKENIDKKVEDKQQINITENKICQE